MSTSDIPQNPANVSTSYNWTVLALPGTILALFGAAMFVGFLGDQASEIAKLIRAIETSCTAVGLHAISPSTYVSPTLVESATCSAYIWKVALFYALALAWCVCAFVATANLGQSLRWSGLRMLACVLVALSAPVLILCKFLIDGQHREYFIVDELKLTWKYESFPLFSFGLIVLLVVAMVPLIYKLASNKSQSYEKSTKNLFFLSIIVYIAVSLIFVYSPGNPYDSIGSINIILSFILLAYLFMCGLFLYGRKTGWPVAGLFLFYLLAVSVLGGSENRIEEPQHANVAKEPRVLEWLKARADFNAYEENPSKKYPIYVLASAGGGMYAAMRTAYYLERIQRHCPRFFHHVFAISSVSGGAIGALAFSADQQNRPLKLNQPCDFSPLLRTDVMVATPPPSSLDRFFASDVVSSIVGGGLFPDLLRRLLPLLPNEFNRAESFRSVLSNGWLQSIDANRDKGKVGNSACAVQDYFANCSLAQYWEPGGNFPVMVFNATWVKNGMPTVLSNLPEDYFSKANALTSMVYGLGYSRKAKLVDAASISSRFPVALPAGVLNMSTTDGIRRPFRLVDGGYFDNSGLITASSVANHIHSTLQENGLTNQAEVRIISLGENYSLDAAGLVEFDEENPSGQETRSVPNSTLQTLTSWLDLSSWLPDGSDLAAHGKALFNARDQRSLKTTDLLAQLIENEAIARNEAGQFFVDFSWKMPDAKKILLPCLRIRLAWYLAPCTREALKESLDFSLKEQPGKLIALQNQLSP